MSIEHSYQELVRMLLTRRSTSAGGETVVAATICHTPATAKPIVCHNHQAGGLLTNDQTPPQGRV